MQVKRFPFIHIGEGFFGAIWRPYAIVALRNGESDSWIPVEMVVDTGADYTLLPRRYADLLGIDVNVVCTPQTTQGVGGAGTVYLYASLKAKLGTWESDIPVGFLERDDVPALLGRKSFLEAVRVRFEKRVTFFG